jgi:hypothetical protein
VLQGRTERQLSVSCEQLQAALEAPEGIAYYSDPAYVAGMGIRLEVEISKADETGQRALGMFLQGFEIQLPGVPDHKVSGTAGVLQLKSYTLHMMSPTGWRTMHESRKPTSVRAERGWGRNVITFTSLSDLNDRLIDGALTCKATFRVMVDDIDSGSVLKSGLFNSR